MLLQYRNKKQKINSYTILLKSFSLIRMHVFVSSLYSSIYITIYISAICSIHGTHENILLRYFLLLVGLLLHLHINPNQNHTRSEKPNYVTLIVVVVVFFSCFFFYSCLKTWIFFLVQSKSIQIFVYIDERE